jgi:hypothetical protein
MDATAFAQAGVTSAQIDYVSLYDSFIITAMLQIEDLGFCPKGEVGRYVMDGNLISGIGRLPINTDGRSAASSACVTPPPPSFSNGIKTLTYVTPAPEPSPDSLLGLPMPGNSWSSIVKNVIGRIGIHGPVAPFAPAQTPGGGRQAIAAGSIPTAI